MINLALNILYKNKTTEIKIIKKNNFYSNYIIIATCSSKKHINKLTNDFILISKNTNFFIYGKNTEWIIIDIHNIVVHIMLKEIRTLYDLESLYLKESSSE